MFLSQSEYAAHVARQVRNWQTAAAETETERLRRVRVSLIAAGLQSAVNRAPDAFPALDCDRLAAAVVDLIERM